MAGQHPVARRRQRADHGIYNKTEERKTRLSTILSFPFLQVGETLYYPSAAAKSGSFSWNWQTFVSGQPTIFPLPVMKVASGVNALGGLFIPRRPRATRVLLGL